ncbi:MAG: OadG family protein [Deltaproteobacteria bacterium]|nr:OadG family protein [Deltaproteobacteria bacterium]
MLLDGLRLMAVGMTTVFVFLTLLVGLMRASAVFFEANAHRFPEADSDDSASGKVGNDEEVAIAIAVALASRRGQGI